MIENLVIGWINYAIGVLVGIWICRSRQSHDSDR